MEEVELKVLEIDNKKYFLLDSISNGKNTYCYFSNLIDNHDVLLMKNQLEDDDGYFISLDTEAEYDYALSLFYDKFHGGLKTENIN